jgi:replicative superfamily II helicase
MEIDSFQRRVEAKFGGSKFTEGAIKAGCAYYKMMNGEPIKSLATAQSSIRLDLDRTMEVVNALDQMSSKWNQKEFFSTLRQRILYGVKPELLDLVSLPGVGKVRAERLHAAGLSIAKINSMSDDALAGVLKVKDMKAIQKLKQDAKLANLRKML